MRNYFKISILFFSAIIFFNSCSSAKNNSNSKDLKNFYIIETELGDITFKVYSQKAPITVKNFLQYIENNKFDGANFYRVVRLDNQPISPIKIEVIQGDFTGVKNQLPMIPHETTKNTGILHKNGTISMARSNPGTASSAFFICINDQPELDYGGKRNPDGQGFAAFGQVIKGMDLVKSIQSGETNEQSLKKSIKIKRIYKNN